MNFFNASCDFLAEIKTFLTSIPIGMSTGASKPKEILTHNIEDTNGFIESKNVIWYNIKTTQFDFQEEEEYM